MTQITTLTPADKKEYLGELMEALHRQSFKDFDLILPDDSPGGVITDMTRQGHFGRLTSGLDLQVVRAPHKARRNHQQLLAKEIEQRLEASIAAKIAEGGLAICNNF